MSGRREPGTHAGTQRLLGRLIIIAAIFAVAVGWAHSDATLIFLSALAMLVCIA